MAAATVAVAIGTGALGVFAAQELTRRKDEIENVNMPFVAQELVDAPQRLASLPDWQVMKEAVDKNEVKPFAG